MPAQLLALTGGEPILLDRPIMLFGRHPECDVQLNSRKISRRHCCVAQVGDALLIRDLGSTNGVKINEERVIEGRLRHGDELTIGNFRYQVLWETAPAAKPAKAAKPVPRAGRAVDDEVLERCDEPVPLAESLSARAKAAVPAAKPARPASPPPVPVPPTIRPPSGGGFYIPDDIGLMPSSGERPLPPLPQTTQSDSSMG